MLERRAATTDYPYSKAMRDSEIVWDEATLQAFVKSPQSVVSGTRMAFGGLDDQKIDPLIDFLQSKHQTQPYAGLADVLTAYLRVAGDRTMSQA